MNYPLVEYHKILSMHVHPRGDKQAFDSGRTCQTCLMTPQTTDIMLSPTDKSLLTLSICIVTILAHAEMS